MAQQERQVILFMHNSRNKTIADLWLRIGAVAIGIILIASIFNIFTDSYYSWRHYGAYYDKLNTLKNTPGERTIFIGGSSTLFGVNAEYYEGLSGEKSINMGLHALKSPDIYLTCTLPYIHQGDTVVIGFEYYVYNSLDTWHEYDDVGLDVAHLSKEYYKDLPLDNALNYLYQQLLRSYEKVSLRLYGSTIEKVMKGTETVYLRENINRYGDMKADFACESKEPDEQNVNLYFNQDSAQILLHYIEKYHDAGATVYLVFPPSYTNAQSADVETFYSSMQDTFGNIVLGSPNDWMLSESSKFYDTGYHLIREEALKRTHYLYDLIHNENQH